MTGVITDEIEVVAGELLPAITLTEALFVPNGLDNILKHIELEVSKHVPDISTERGRKDIASLSRKVASSKARIDEFGKDYVAEIKVKAIAIDAERKRSRDFLDILRDKVRKPLTDWENKESYRVQAHEDALLAVAELGDVPFGATLEDLSKRIDAIEQYVTREWQEFAARFATSYEFISLRLNKLYAETKQAEADRIELQRIREEDARRILAEHEEKLKADAAAKAKAEAEAAAEAAIRAAEEEATRKARAAEAEAKRMQDEANERTRKAEEATAKAVRDGELALERERQAVAAKQKAEADALAKREANKKHVDAINLAAVDAIVRASAITEAQAVLIVAAIATGEVPAVRISY